MLARTLFDDYGMVDAEVAKDEVARNVLDEQPVVYIQEIHLQERYQRTGVFKWILQNVSSLEALKAASIENELEKCRSSAEFASSAEPAKSIIAQPTVFYASEIAGGPSSPNGSIRTGDNHEAQGRQKDLEDDHHKAFVQVSCCTLLDMTWREFLTFGQNPSSLASNALQIPHITFTI